MLDNIEYGMARETELGNDRLDTIEVPTRCEAFVPMLDWPSNLFAVFTADIDEDSEY